MVEKQPQEPSSQQIVSEHRQEADKSLLEKARHVPSENFNSAQAKAEAFNGLKGEIDTEMLGILEKMEGLSQKVKANIRSDENPEGLLTRREEEYLRCLETGHRELEDLLR